MANWSTRLLSEYVLSTEPGADSGQMAFTVTVSGNGFPTPQTGTISFTVAAQMVTEIISDLATLGFTVQPIDIADGYYDSGRAEFVVFPQGFGSITDTKTKKDQLYNVTIK